MAFKLIESAHDHRRMVNAPHLVALVRAGATFINGKLVERPGEEAKPEAAKRSTGRHASRRSPELAEGPGSSALAGVSCELEGLN
jgi:hypothetical protein